MRSLATLLIHLFAGMASLAFAQEQQPAGRREAPSLAVGDEVPRLAVSKWLNGEGMDELEPGRVYLISFWAPSATDIDATAEKLTAIARANPDVTLIAIDVGEQNATDAKKLAKQIGSKLECPIGIDDASRVRNGKMAREWLEAAGQDSLPAVFLVNRDSTLAYFGKVDHLETAIAHLPGDLADPLSPDEIARRDKAARDAVQMQADFDRTVMRLSLLGDNLGAAKAIDALVTKYPESASMLLYSKFQYLVAAEEYEQAYATADACEKYDDAEALNDVAWTIVDQEGVAKRDLARAMRYAKRSVERSHSKVAAYIDTLARVYFEQGELDRAIELQTQALSIATRGEERAQLDAAMERYRAALPK